MTDLIVRAIDACGLVVLVTDRGGRIVRATRDVEETLGVTSVVGRSLLDLCSGAGASVVADVAAGTAGPVLTELRDRLPGVSGAPVPVRLEPLGDGEHVVASFTRPRPARMRLGDAAHLVRAASAEGIWDWDVRSGEVWWSAEMSAMLGGPAEPSIAPLAERFDGVVHPEDMPRARAALERLLAGEEAVYTVEARMRTRAGDDRWCLIRGACERDGSGDPVRVAGSVLDVHERRRAEQQVLESERRYRELANSLPQFVWSARADGAVDQLNDRFYEVTGLPRDLVGDEAWSPAIHPDDLPPMLERWARSVATGEAYEVVTRIRVHGEWRWHLVQARAEREEDGTIRRWYGTGTDIHERREAEEARRRAQERLESTVDGASLGVWEWDLLGGELHVNDRWASILGYRRSELEPITVGTWRRLCHPEDAERAVEQARRHLRGETERYDAEFRMRHRAGHEVWIRSWGRVVERDADGEPRRMFGLHEDVSERRRIEARLRESEQRFRRLFEEGRDAVLLLEGDRVIDANPAAATMFGTERAAELVGTSILARSPERQPDGSATAEALAARIAEAEEAGGSRFEWVHRDGSGERFWVETILTSLTSDGRRIVHAILRDIGARKRLEASLQRSIAEAQAASRAKSEFLANMSHEIRTPMTAILGFAGLVERDLRTGDRTVLLPEAMATIRRNGEHLLELINDILDLSKIEAGRMTVERVPVSPVAMVEEVAVLMRDRAKHKGLAFRVTLEDGLPESISSDPVRVRQILVNLVGNAVKFTSTGEVRLVVRRVGGGTSTHADGGPAGASVTGLGGPVTAADRLRVEVHDTGIGMTPEQTSRVFEAFTQADSSTTRTYGGTGLGLRISASLAAMLGGTIDVRSERGVGSVFALELPLEATSAPRGREMATGAGDGPAPWRATPGSRTGAEEHDGVDPSPARASGPPVGGPAAGDRPLAGRRLLLAEDAPDVRSLLVVLLRQGGAEVMVANDGLEAVRTADDAAADGRPFDAVLMDMQMPLLDGYAATRRLRATGHEMPVIAVTAHAMTGDRERCLAVGCNDHLAKPCTQEELLDVVRRQLDGRRDDRRDDVAD